MKPVMYIIANKGLNMSPGKLAAQVAHAAIGAFTESDPAMVDEWMNAGHAKIVLEARDTEHMQLAERFITSKGIQSFPIIDEGRTEIAPHSFTALASIVVDKSDENVKSAFEDFKTYKAPKVESRKVEIKFKDWYRGIKEV